MARTLIRRSRLIDPASGHDEVVDVAIDGDRVAAVGADLSQQPADEVIDAEGLIVAPGLIDPHVHLREPGQEDRETIAGGTAAAVRGGFTSVACMPNTDPAIDSPEVVRAVLRRAEETAACRVFPVGAVSVGRRGEALTEFSLMARAGVVGYSDDGDAVASAGLMSAALREAESLGLPVMQHCQEPTLTGGASMNAGETATRLGLRGWPAIAEEIIIERDLRLTRQACARYHVQHVSSAGSVEILSRAKRDASLAPLVTCEATPHHLTLTERACDGYDAQAKVNPPLRRQADRDALRQAVADGVIDMLATDHAPHTAESKARDFESASFGMVGLETALPLYIESLLDAGAVAWPRLIEMLTLAPARLCGLDRLGLGAITESGPADLTLIDPDSPWTLRMEDLGGSARNTPFADRALRGRVVRTIVAGRTVFSLDSSGAGGR